MTAKPKAGTRNRPEQTKAAILRFALREFAAHGVAGARTGAIARAAGVNKALIHYYFENKETLYGATLDAVFAELSRTLIAVLERDLPPRQKLLAFLGTYFEFVAGNPAYPRLVQQEMMRSGGRPSPHIERIVESYQKPVMQRLRSLFEKGIRGGQFRKVDVAQFVPSMVAVVVFYFANLPMLRAIMAGDPLSPERLAARKAAVLDFITSALFTRSPAPRRRPTRN